MTNWAWGSLARGRDRPMTRPVGIAYWLDDRPPAHILLALALQQLALQSVFFVIPALLASSLSNDPADAVRFLSLSIFAAAGWQVLMILTRGQVGAGYPLPSAFASALFSAYALVAEAGHGFGAAGAMLAVTGAVAVVFTFMMHRVRVVLPNEVAGVVVILIGVTLVVLGAQRLGLKDGQVPAAGQVATALGSLLMMTLVALFRTRVAPFAVLIGAVVGTAVSVWLGQARPDAAEVLASRPWIALPQPWMPRFDQITPAPMVAFLVALVALKATSVGSLVMLQRSLDARWSKPDAPPIRRGLLANGLGMGLAGLVGGACPNPGTAAMSLSIATGTLSRSIVWLGAGLLVVVALCPKLVVLFVLVPEPVKSAMLLYVAGLIITQGCGLVTARLLDTRRTLIVAFGLTAGIVQAAAPQALGTTIPALASPISVGALVAFVINLLTLPLVAQRASLNVTLDGQGGRLVSDWLAHVSGAWALKAQTARTADQSLGELTELLHERGVRQVKVDARLAEDRVEFSLNWTGNPLPEPPTHAHVDDLMGDDRTRHAFSVWLATRQAQSFRMQATGDAHEARIVFED